MELAEIEQRLSDVWAKSPDPKGASSPVTLFRHSLDVTTQMAEFFRLYQPCWPISDDDVCVPRILAYAALTHDFGKVHPGFQAALRPNGPRFQNRHEILSLAFLACLDIPANERPWIESALALHHKDLIQLTGPNQPFYLGRLFGAEGTAARRLAEGLAPGYVQSQLQLLCELLNRAPQVFSSCGWEPFECYRVTRGFPTEIVGEIRGALERVKGLAERFEPVLDDFLRLLQPLPWPLRRAGVTVRGFMLNADHVASFCPYPLKKAIDNVQLLSRTLPSTVSGFKGLNSHQEAAGRLVGSGVLIAPTGTGKTEAALLWAARQAEDGLNGRAFILLPYQASMNAMQKRLVRMIAPEVLQQPEKWNAEIALVHGRSIRAVYERLLAEDDTRENAEKMAHIQNDLARLNIAPVRVGSPFQIIRLLFAPRAIEGLLTAFMQARLIFDEVHAYDPGVTALALASVRFLCDQLGSRVFFMTATLPSHLAGILGKLFTPMTIIRPDPDVMDRPARHRLRLMPPGVDVLSEPSITDIRKAADAGSVLVVVNQVGRARNLWRLLRSKIPDVHLLHSRFTHYDRARIETELDPRHGRVLIATQAVEVSLDLDYDTCFSELAPLESLLQRFGRCNRKGSRAEPAIVSVYRTFPEPSRVAHLPYRHDHLQRTLEVLESFLTKDPRGLIVETTVQELLDTSYPESLRRELENEIDSKIGAMNKEYIEPFVPFGKRDDSVNRFLEEEWQKLFDGEEVLPMDLIPCAAREPGWLGRTRYHVPISGRRFAQLLQAGRIRWNDELMCNVVNAPYTEEGLDV
jgi:CRISPR-associated endonuclease/helicase Cas3